MAKDLRWTTQYIIGVDEAGRGPLAGPVAVGVSCIPKEHQKELFKLLKKVGLNDSKQVKEHTREALFQILTQLKKEQKINWAVILVSAKIISTKGIVFAVNLGIKKGLEKIKSSSFEKETELELDGALKIPPGEWKKASVIIKGDSIKPSIMIASILAKVTRDRYMKKLSKKIPQYGFEIHKGYGTLKHRNLIKNHGLSKEHRVGWCKIDKTP
jgi:ribonuclease HII